MATPPLPVPSTSRVPSSKGCLGDSAHPQAPCWSLAQSKTAQKPQLSFSSLTEQPECPLPPCSFHFLCLALILVDPEGRAETQGSGAMAPGGLGVSAHSGPHAWRQLGGPSGLDGEGRCRCHAQDGVPRPRLPDPSRALPQRPFSVRLLGEHELGVGAWEGGTPGFPQASG